MCGRMAWMLCIRRAGDTVHGVQGRKRRADPVEPLWLEQGKMNRSNGKGESALR